MSRLPKRGRKKVGGFDALIPLPAGLRERPEREAAMKKTPGTGAAAVPFTSYPFHLALNPVTQSET